MKRFIEEAKKLIRINSVSSHGNEEIANYVAALMQDRSMKIHMQTVTHSLEDVSKRQFNVFGILGDSLVDRKIRKGLLLLTHLDTVGPGLLDNWGETGRDPFNATLKDGRIYGLGAADVKLDFLCKLHAVEKFREKKLRAPIYLVGTCGEEVGMFGARYLIQSFALNPQAVLVGEPTELRIVAAHKGLNIFKVSLEFQMIERDARGFNRKIHFYAFGKSAHSAYPHLGNNALLEALTFLKNARNAGFEMRFTDVQGGDTVNKVPDQASFEFYLDSHQFEDFKRFFREAIRHQEKEKSFRVELGGVGDTGVKFLPEEIFECLVQVVDVFRQLDQSLAERRDEGFDPPVSTMNIGRIHQRLGGVDLYFDLRLLPDISPADIEKKIQEEVVKVAEKYQQMNITASRQRMNPGFQMSEDSTFVHSAKKAAEAVGLDPMIAKKATSTEASQYFQAGYPALVFGAGLSQGNSHGPNEWNSLEQLQKAILFYEKMIEDICL